MLNASPAIALRDARAAMRWMSPVMFRSLLASTTTDAAPRRRTRVDVAPVLGLNLARGAALVTARAELGRLPATIHAPERFGLTGRRRPLPRRYRRSKGGAGSGSLPGNGPAPCTGLTNTGLTNTGHTGALRRIRLPRGILDGPVKRICGPIDVGAADRFDGQAVRPRGLPDRSVRGALQSRGPSARPVRLPHVRVDPGAIDVDGVVVTHVDID